MKTKKYKLSNNIPSWLYNLEKGYWTTKEIIALTKQSRVNITLKMKAIGVEYQEYYDKNSCRWMNKYNWKGVEFYLKRNLREIINAKKS